VSPVPRHRPRPLAGGSGRRRGGSA
jgi:hypothetical protein